jgi:16S rRNA (uracil1498-N3)-methyltransferase
VDVADEAGDGEVGFDRTEVTPATATAHVFVDDVDAPHLAEDDHRHLSRVLRLRPGDDVTVADGAGRWRACRMTDGTALEVAGDVVADVRPAPPITIAFAIVKGDRPELVVQKLTEVGVDRILPFTAERSVVRWDEAKIAKQSVRFAHIAREAAMQCRRTFLPSVAALSDFRAVAELPGAGLAERTGVPPSLSVPTLLIGPEGGWGSAEKAVLLPSVRIGAHTLRSETAAITAGALLVAMRSRLVGEAVPSQLEGPHAP